MPEGKLASAWRIPGGTTGNDNDNKSQKVGKMNKKLLTGAFGAAILALGARARKGR